MRLLIALSPRPFEEAGGRYDAAAPLERLAEHRLFGNRLGARVEGRGHFLQSFFPKKRYQTPAHRNQFAAAVLIEAHDIDVDGRRDVVMRAQVLRRTKQA